MSRIRADQLVNRVGSGGPKFPNGVADGFSVSGIVTATSFAGNLTGNVTGNLTGNADTATSATLATTATNAQGLTGTPNITVQNATVQGNLTVNGTTTTIDTVVTAVDSLAVDGQITGLGNLGIGTVTPGAKTHIVGSSSGGGKLFIDTLGTFSGTDTSTLGFSVFRGSSNVRSNSQAEIECVGDGNYSGSLVFKTQNPGTYPNSLVERLRITSGGTLFSYSPDDTTPNFKWRSDDTNWHGALNISVEGASIASFWSTGGDWSVNGATYSCTKNVAAYPSSAIAVHNQYNSSFESKFVFLKKAGGSTTTDGGVTELASISSAGIISDSIGPLRRLGINGQSGAYTLVATDAGKAVTQSTNSAGVTVPNSVFTAGDMVTIINDTGTNINIIQGTGVTMYNTADAATGTRTLAQRGAATLLFTSASVAYISGSGLS